jgi:hypothetical protein
LESHSTGSEREDSRRGDGLSIACRMFKGTVICGEGSVIGCLFCQCKKISRRDQASICTGYIYSSEPTIEGKSPTFMSLTGKVSEECGGDDVLQNYIFGQSFPQ